MPSELFESLADIFISGKVFFQLCKPPFGAGFGDHGVFAAVEVPEAGMDEDGGLAFGKNQIGFFRKGFLM